MTFLGSPMKTVHKYQLTATVSGSIPYDPDKPDTYTAALKTVADMREALEALGATVTGRSGPAKVRE